MGQTRLVQIATNLIVNACDAIGERVGTIAIEAHEYDSDVEICFDDDGDGIAPSQREHVFEPFVTTKAEGKGTGLGLALCRSFVDAAGGAIYAGESPLGGTRFTVRLPRVEPCLETTPAELQALAFAPMTRPGAETLESGAYPSV